GAAQRHDDRLDRPPFYAWRLPPPAFRSGPNRNGIASARRAAGGGGESRQGRTPARPQRKGRRRFHRRPRGRNSPTQPYLMLLRLVAKASLATKAALHQLEPSPPGFKLVTFPALNVEV